MIDSILSILFAVSFSIQHCIQAKDQVAGPLELSTKIYCDGANNESNQPLPERQVPILTSIHMRELLRSDPDHAVLPLTSSCADVFPEEHCIGAIDSIETFKAVIAQKEMTTEQTVVDVQDTITNSQGCSKYWEEIEYLSIWSSHSINVWLETELIYVLDMLYQCHQEVSGQAYQHWPLLTLLPRDYTALKQLGYPRSTSPLHLLFSNRPAAVLPSIAEPGYWHAIAVRSSEEIQLTIRSSNPFYGELDGLDYKSPTVSLPFVFSDSQDGINAAFELRYLNRIIIAAKANSLMGLSRTDSDIALLSFVSGAALAQVPSASLQSLFLLLRIDEEALSGDQLRLARTAAIASAQSLAHTNIPIETPNFPHGVLSRPFHPKFGYPAAWPFILDSIAKGDCEAAMGILKAVASSPEDLHYYYRFFFFRASQPFRGAAELDQTCQTLFQTYAIAQPDCDNECTRTAIWSLLRADLVRAQLYHALVRTSAREIQIAANSVNCPSGFRNALRARQRMFDLRSALFLLFRTLSFERDDSGAWSAIGNNIEFLHDRDRRGSLLPVYAIRYNVENPYGAVSPEEDLMASFLALGENAVDPFVRTFYPSHTFPDQLHDTTDHRRARLEQWVNDGIKEGTYAPLLKLAFVEWFSGAFFHLERDATSLRLEYDPEEAFRDDIITLDIALRHLKSIESTRHYLFLETLILVRQILSSSFPIFENGDCDTDSNSGLDLTEFQLLFPNTAPRLSRPDIWEGEGCDFLDNYLARAKGEGATWLDGSSVGGTDRVGKIQEDDILHGSENDNFCGFFHHDRGDYRGFYCSRVLAANNDFAHNIVMASLERLTSCLPDHWLLVNEGCVGRNFSGSLFNGCNVQFRSGPIGLWFYSNVHPSGLSLGLQVDADALSSFRPLGAIESPRAVYEHLDTAAILGFRRERDSYVRQFIEWANGERCEFTQQEMPGGHQLTTRFVGRWSVVQQFRGSRILIEMTHADGTSISLGIDEQLGELFLEAGGETRVMTTPNSEFGEKMRSVEATLAECDIP